MTSSTTSTKAAANGSPADTETEAKPAERQRGIARLREEEAYHLTGLVLSALAEAEHLIRQVHDKASDRYTDYSGKRGTAPLRPAEVADTLGEAYQCATTAMTYIDNAAMRWLDENEPIPFQVT